MSASDRPARRHLWSGARWIGALLLAGALTGCREPAGAPPGAPSNELAGELAGALPGGPSGAAGPVEPRALRVIQPKETPRTGLFARAEARMLDADECEVVLQLRSPLGGSAGVEFVPSEGITASRGDLRREAPLAPGDLREERVVLRVPRDGYHLVAVVAELNGRRSEAYVEFGVRPSASERGLRTRESEDGRRILRVGPEE